MGKNYKKKAPVLLMRAAHPIEPVHHNRIRQGDIFDFALGTRRPAPPPPSPKIYITLKQMMASSTKSPSSLLHLIPPPLVDNGNYPSLLLSSPPRRKNQTVSHLTGSYEGIRIDLALPAQVIEQTIPLLLEGISQEPSRTKGR